MVLGKLKEARARRFVTWLGRQTDLSFRLHGGLLGGRGVHYSSLILGEKREANWEPKARAKWGAPRWCWEKATGENGSKKERDVSLTRDLPRTINCGGAEIIRDFVVVTCDANKSFVPITYAHLKLKPRKSANLKTCVCSTRRVSGKRENSKVNSERDSWLPFALTPEFLQIVIIFLLFWHLDLIYLFARINTIILNLNNDDILLFN